MNEEPKAVRSPWFPFSSLLFAHAFGCTCTEAHLGGKMAFRGAKLKS